MTGVIRPATAAFYGNVHLLPLMLVIAASYFFFPSEKKAYEGSFIFGYCKNLFGLAQRQAFVSFCAYKRRHGFD